MKSFHPAMRWPFDRSSEMTTLSTLCWPASNWTVISPFSGPRLVATGILLVSVRPMQALLPKRRSHSVLNSPAHSTNGCVTTPAVLGGILSIRPAPAPMHCRPYKSMPAATLNLGWAPPCQNQPELLRLVSHWYASQVFAELFEVPIGYAGDQRVFAPSRTYPPSVPTSVHSRPAMEAPGWYLSTRSRKSSFP